jgi:hypothetical protein
MNAHVATSGGGKIIEGRGILAECACGGAAQFNLASIVLALLVQKDAQASSREKDAIATVEQSQGIHACACLGEDAEEGAVAMTKVPWCAA